MTCRLLRTSGPGWSGDATLWRGARHGEETCRLRWTLLLSLSSSLQFMSRTDGLPCCANGRVTLNHPTSSPTGNIKSMPDCYSILAEEASFTNGDGAAYYVDAVHPMWGWSRHMACYNYLCLFQATGLAGSLVAAKRSQHPLSTWALSAVDDSCIVYVLCCCCC